MVVGCKNDEGEKGGIPSIAYRVSFVEGTSVVTRKSFISFTLDHNNGQAIDSSEYDSLPIKFFQNPEIGVGLVTRQLNRSGVPDEVNADDFNGAITHAGVYWSGITTKAPIIASQMHYQTVTISGNTLKLGLFYSIYEKKDGIDVVKKHTVTINNISDVTRVYNEKGKLQSMTLMNVHIEFFE